MCALSFNTPELKQTLPLRRDSQHRCRWDQTAVVFAPEACNRPRNKAATSSLCRLVHYITFPNTRGACKYQKLRMRNGRYTQDGDTVSLRSWDVDACHSAPDVVTLVTLNRLVCIRSKNTVTRCASPVYDITDPTVQAKGCPADMLTVTFTRQFVIVHEKR